MSLKEDGLTIRITYIDGRLTKMETRGDGIEGADVTHLAPVFKNIPLKISEKITMIVDGEAIIRTDDFERVNALYDSQYKNPRNLASGSVSLLSTEEASKRELSFIAWKLVDLNLLNEFTTKLDYSSRLHLLREIGFTVVPFISNIICTEYYINEALDKIKIHAYDNCHPFDGVCIFYEDIDYGDSLGKTEHHFNNGVAYKFEDEVKKTKLLDIEWTMGRTGTLTPTAVFDMVELEGTEVSRASCHNVTYLKNMDLHIGDEIGVKKCNQIIPQLQENYTKHDSFDPAIIIDTCPICGSKTEIIQDNETEVLVCTNYSCQGKRLGQLNHFVSKECMNIDGFSEKGLELLIEKGFINTYYDIYTLYEHKDELIKLDRFGQKKVENLLESIENSKNCDLVHFITAFGIPLIGKTASKLISKECHGDFKYFVEMMDMHFDWTTLQGFGKTMYVSLFDWWIENRQMMQEIAMLMNFKTEEKKVVGYDLNGKSFCITGSLGYFKNRDELVKNIEEHNGKVVSGVSKKTDYLINNDTESTSSKNKKAKELNIPIISELDYLNIIKQ